VSIDGEGQGSIPVKFTVTYTERYLEWFTWKTRTKSLPPVTLGYINLPKYQAVPTYTPPPVTYLAGNKGTNPAAWSTWSGGDLHLNMGNRSSVRGIAEAETDETFTIEHVGGDANSESVRVGFRGEQKTYHQVTKIVAHAGDGDDEIIVGDGVLVPVELHGDGGDDILSHRGRGHADLYGGDDDDYLEATGNAGTADYKGGGGHDEITHNGSGSATINGGIGNDQLRGGSAADVIDGGDDDDTIDGRGGVDTIDGGAGDDRIEWQAAQLVLNNVQGGAGQDELVITVTASDDDLVISTLQAQAFKFARMSNGSEWGSIEAAGIENLIVDTLAGADEVTVRGTGGDDTVILDGRNESGGSMQDAGIAITDAADTAVVDILLTDCRRSDGDVLIIDTLGGHDTIDATGLEDPDTQDNVTYPDLIALKLMGGDGDDDIIGSPFDDMIDGGPGSDTMTGGEGDDNFFEASAGNPVDIDTLKESVDADIGLFGNLLVVGTLLKDAGQTPFATGTAPSQKLTDTGDRFAAGAAVDTLNGFFEKAVLTGGTGNNTFVVNDADGSIQVGSTIFSVSPWAGIADLDSADNNGNFDEHYLVAVTPGNGGQIRIVDSGTGDDRLVVTCTGQSDWLDLDTSTNSTITATGTSSIHVGFQGVEHVDVDTGSGDDQIAVRAIDVETTVYCGDGDNLVLVGSGALVGTTPSNDNGTLTGINAPLNVHGEGVTGFDVLDVDDTGHTGGSGTLTQGLIQNLGNGNDIVYSDFESLNLEVGAYPLSVDITSTDLQKLSVNAGGTLTVPEVAIPSGEVRLTADNMTDVTTISADIVALSSNQNILKDTGTSGSITAESLDVTAGGNVDLDTAVDSLIVTADGQITVSESDDVDVESLESISGAITLSAVGDIIADHVHSKSQSVTLSASAHDIIITGDVIAASNIELTGENIRISPTGGVEAGANVELDAAVEIYMDMTLATGSGKSNESESGAKAGTEYTVFDIDVDQIGWYDPGSEKEYEASDPGQPLLVPYSDDHLHPGDLGVPYGKVALTDFATLAPDADAIWNDLLSLGYISVDGDILAKYIGLTQAFQNDLSGYAVSQVAETARILDSKVPLKKLYQVTYRPGSGRIVIDRNGTPGGYPYVPAWSSSTQWEYYPASQVLGDNIDQLPPTERPDFYVKIQLGALDDIRRSVYVDADAVTYEDIGDTGRTTNVKLHQIGWWNTTWSDATWQGAAGANSDNGGYADYKAFTQAYRDSRKQVTAGPAYEFNNLLQQGVAKPAGGDWVPWYGLEVVSDTRFVDMLAPGADYHYSETPGWTQPAAFETVELVSGLWVEVPYYWQSVQDAHGQSIQVKVSAADDLDALLQTGSLTDLNHALLDKSHNITGYEANPGLDDHILVDAEQLQQRIAEKIGEFREYLGDTRDYLGYKLVDTGRDTWGTKVYGGNLWTWPAACQKAYDEAPYIGRWDYYSPSEQKRVDDVRFYYRGWWRNIFGQRYTEAWKPVSKGVVPLFPFLAESAEIKCDVKYSIYQAKDVYGPYYDHYSGDPYDQSEKPGAYRDYINGIWMYYDNEAYPSYPRQGFVQWLENNAYRAVDWVQGRYTTDTDVDPMAWWKAYSPAYVHDTSPKPRYTKEFDRVAWGADSGNSLWTMTDSGQPGGNAFYQKTSAPGGWDQVVVGHHWQYQGHVYHAKAAWNEYPGDDNDVATYDLFWTENPDTGLYTADHETINDNAPQHVPGGTDPGGHYVRVDDFESRQHYAYEHMTSGDVRDPRRHFNFRYTSETRPYYESFPVKAVSLDATAGSRIQINTEVDKIQEAEVTGAGNVTITQLDAVVVEHITTADGSITLDVLSSGSDGTIDARLINGGGDTPGIGITLRTEKGDISVGRIETGTANGFIHLRTPDGSIQDADNPDTADVDLSARVCFYYVWPANPDLSDLETDPGMTIIGLNDDLFSTDENTSLSISSADLLDNDDELPNDTGLLNVAQIDTSGTVGQVTGNPTDGYTYDPKGKFDHLNSGQSAFDRFTYYVTYPVNDGNVTVEGATASVEVTGVGGAPKVTVTGIVHDQPVAGAEVHALLDGVVIGSVATTDTSGQFTLTIPRDQLTPDSRLVIEALKPADDQIPVEMIRLLSFLPAVAELNLPEDADSVISHQQIPELIVSNITSVAFLLIDENQDGTIDPVELGTVLELLDAHPAAVTEAIRSAAAVVKVFTDDPSQLNAVIGAITQAVSWQGPLPDDILELAGGLLEGVTPGDLDSVLNIANQLIGWVEGLLPGKVQEAAQAMRNDSTLADQYETWANGPPTVLIPGWTATDEDQPVTLGLTGVDTAGNVTSIAVDPDGDPITMVPVSDPLHGVLTSDTPGVFTYAPDPDFYGEDSFDFVFSDGVRESARTTYSITVLPVNDAPVLEAIDDQSVVEGDTLTFTAQASDPDMPNDALGFSLGGAAPAGAAIDPFTGVFAWTLAGVPGPGAVPVTVRVTDRMSSYDEKTLTISVANAAPAAKNDEASTDEDTALDATVLALSNDVDPGGDVLSVTGLDISETIGLAVLNSGTLTYDPNGQFEFLADGQTATDRFDYTIDDGDGGVATATVIVTITGVNDAPVAADDTYEVDENGTLTVWPEDGLLKNDADIDQDVLTAAVASHPANGSLVLNDDGSFSYTPDPEFVGVDTFTYTAGDGDAVSAPATVTITVHRVIELTGVATDGPIADAIVVALVNGELAGGPAETNLSGEFTLTFRPDQLPADARLILKALKSGEGIKLMSLLPKIAELDDLSGVSDVLSYLDKSELKLSNITSAVFTMMDTDKDGKVNETEKAEFEILLTGSPITKQAIRGMAAAIKVLIDDPDVELATVISLVSDAVQQPEDVKDILELIGNPAALERFKSIFSKEIRSAVEAMRQDPVLLGQFATYANNLPVANDLDVTTPEDEPLAGVRVGLDPDNDPLSVSLVSGPGHGTLVITDSGELTYTPDPNFNGGDSFTYTVNDGIGDSNVGTVNITVTPVNDPPQLLPIPDQAVTEGETLTFTAVADDPDLNMPADTLNFSLVGDVPGGATIDSATGEFSWAPSEEQGPWTYRLTVRVDDAGSPALTDTRTVMITVFDDENMDAGPQADNGVADTYRLRVNGSSIEALLNGTVVFSSPLAGALPLTINGSSDNDTLIIDLSNGNPIPADGIEFIGDGPSDFDTMVVTGGSANQITHTFTGAGSGAIDLDGSAITYTGLEPILDEMDATNRVFTFSGADDDIFIDDDAMPNDNYSSMWSAGTSESVDFRNPTGSLTVNAGGGDDTADIKQFDTGPDGGPVNFEVIVNGESGELRIETLNAGSTRAAELTSDGGILGIGPITASDLTVTAGGNVDLKTAIDTLYATTTAVGDITITETDGISLDNVQAADGSITVTAGGKITAVLVESQTDSDTNDITLTALTDDIQGGTINAGSDGDVTLTSAGALATTVAADVLTVGSATTMTLTTTVASLDAEITGAGKVTVTETNAISLDNVQVASGSITVTAEGNLAAEKVTAGGDDQNVTLRTITSGDIYIGSVTAKGDTIAVASAGAVEESGDDADADLTAAVLDIDAVTGIGAVARIETAAPGIAADTTTVDIDLENTLTSLVTVTSLTTDTGGIQFSQAGGGALTVNKAETGDGAISFDVTDANLTAEKVTTGGTNKNVTLKTITSGDISIGSVIAEGDTITVTSAGAVEESGDDPQADLTAAVLDIDAVSGIGEAEPIETSAAGISADTTDGDIDLDNTLAAAVTVTSLTTGTGDIGFSQVGGGDLTVSKAETGDGSIFVEVTEANLITEEVTAGGTNRDVTLMTITSGDISIGSVIAEDDTITVTSAGAIEESGDDPQADLTAAVLDIDAATGIGAVAGIETAAGGIAADTTDGDIDLDNTLASLVTVTSLTTGTGDIEFSQVSGGDLTVSKAETGDGAIFIEVTEGSLIAEDVTAGSDDRDVTLSTITSGDMYIDSVIAEGDTITVTSAGAVEESGDDAQSELTAAVLDIDAVSGIGQAETIETAAARIAADTTNGDIDLENTLASLVTVTSLTTGTGNIGFSQAGGGDLTVGEAETGDGAIFIEVTEGDLTVEKVTAGGNAQNVDIRTVTSGNMYIGSVIAEGDTISVTSADAVNEIESGDLEVDFVADLLLLTVQDEIGGAGKLDIETTVSSLQGESRLAGDIIITETDDIELASLRTANGSITVTADGSITAVLIESMEDADTNDITLTATEDIQGGVVDAGSNGDVDLNAGGAITATVTADELTATATGDLMLTTTVNSLEASNQGEFTVTEADSVKMVTDVASLSLTIEESGDAIVEEKDDLTLATAELFNGTMTVFADNITVTGTVSANELTLEARGEIFSDPLGRLVADRHTARADGAMVLNTSVNQLTAATPGALTVTETDGIELTTDVGSLNLVVEGSGDAIVTETDGIALFFVRMFDGAISVTAGGTITALYVESLTDLEGNDINLTTTNGDVLIDSITVGKAYAGISIVSAGDIREVASTDPDVDVTGNHALIIAAGEFGSKTEPELNLELDINLQGSSGGDVVYDVVGDVSLIVFASGTVKFTSTGTITVVQVQSGAGDISLESTGGDIVLGYLDAGADDGTVRLTAAGSIYEDPEDDAIDLVASTAYLTAGVSIGGPGAGQDLETDVDTLVAEVTGSTIYLNEVDDIELVSVDAPEGEIVIKAGGDVLISGPVSTGETAGHIRLEAAKELYMTGKDPITTHLMEVFADSGIFLHTKVAVVDAHVAIAGKIEIHESDAIVLRDVTNTEGPIHVIARGELTATHVECLADKKGNNVGLMTLSGDILVDHVGVGSEHCQVSLTSAGHILEVDQSDPEMDLHGAMGILCADGKIDRGMDRLFKRIHKWSKKTALYEFDRGRALRLHGVKGDVELFVHLENSVYVSATGDIHVAHLNSNGHDIALRSKCGDIFVDHLTTGPDKGDLELKAKGDVYLAGERYSGDFGQITSGDDIDISADGNVYIFGSVAAGFDSAASKTKKRCWWNKTSPDVRIDSEAEVFIHGAIASQDDVDIRADDGVVVDAPITAEDDIEIRTCGAIITTENGSLTAGDDVELFAKQFINIDAEITAGDDVRITSERSDVLINGPVLAGDRIDIRAGESLFISGPLEAGSDLDLYAKYDLVSTHEEATFTAGVDVELETRWGDIEIWGAVTSGNGHTCSPDVLIDSGGRLGVYADITSLDDVKIRADDGIFIDAPITAEDDIEIRTCGDVETTCNAPLETAGDIDLYAAGSIILSAEVISGDDVRIGTEDGFLFIEEPVYALDDIDIHSGDALVISAAVAAGGDLDLYATYELMSTDAQATLTAGVDVELETRWGDIEIWGAVTSGNGQTCSPDVLIDSGGWLGIFAPITSLDDVEIWADGGILITETITAEDEIEIGTCGDLIISAAIVAGTDLDLYAGYDLATTDASVTLTAGVDVEIETRYGDIELLGAVHSGNGQTCSPDVLIDSGGWLGILAPITSLDDVEIRADDGILITDAVIAVDEIEIRTCGDLTTTSNAPLSAGDHVTLWAKHRLTIGAPVLSGGDIRITSDDGDLMIRGDVTSPGNIDILADGNLTVHAAMIAEGDLDLYAEQLMIIGPEASLTAGVDVELETRYGDIVLMGPIQSGNGQTCSPDVLIRSGGWLEIYEFITSLDDVEGWARDGIYIDAPILVEDHITLTTCGELATGINSALSAGSDLKLSAGTGMIIDGLAEAGGDISIHAKGTVSIGAPVFAGDDVRITSCHGDVLNDGAIDAGDDIDVYAGEDLLISAAMEAGGEIDLYAKYDLTSTHPGASLTAGEDVKIKTRYGDIVLHGAVNAGNGAEAALQSRSCRRYTESPDVWIDSGAGLTIHGNISAQDDIDLRADEEIIVTASIFASDELEMKTSGAMTIAETARIVAEDDIDLYSKSDMVISGKVTSADDVYFTSCGNVLIDGTVQAADDVCGYARRDLTVSGLVAAGDRICLKSRDDMHITSTGVLSGIDNNPARSIYLCARDQMIVDGKILADRICIR